MAKRVNVIKWLWLGVVAVVYGEDPVEVLDEIVARKTEETQRMLLGVEKQLSDAHEVAHLFVLEETQLEMLALEIRAKMKTIQEETRDVIQDAMIEVEFLQEAVVKNATMWRKTLHGLKDATETNRETLERLRKRKEEEKKLKVELELQQEQEVQLKRELEMLQELEKQQEKETELKHQAEDELQRLERLATVEQDDEQNKAFTTRQMEPKQVHASEIEEESQCENQVEQKKLETSMFESTHEVVDVPADLQNKSWLKQWLTWYVYAEQTVEQVAVILYRQLLLPVVAILGVFFVVAICIGTFSGKRARQKQRVMYSDYPPRYRPKPKQK